MLLVIYQWQLAGPKKFTPPQQTSASLTSQAVHRCTKLGVLVGSSVESPGPNRSISSCWHGGVDREVLGVAKQMQCYVSVEHVIDFIKDDNASNQTCEGSPCWPVDSNPSPAAPLLAGIPTYQFEHSHWFRRFPSAECADLTEGARKHGFEHFVDGAEVFTSSFVPGCISRSPGGML